MINHKTGKMEWDAISDVWGNAVDIFNPYKLRQPIRMQGQNYDEESGLHYNRHRYYDPAPGRYITQDPIGLRGGWNLYAHALVPVLGGDPLGLNWASLGDMANQSGIKDSANRAQQQILEPWYVNAGTFSILNTTNKDMKRLNLGKSDQFFHCTASCRVSKSSGYNKAWATSLGGMKEMRDFALNKFGLYGKGKLSEEDMLRDNLADLEVNSYGLSCPSQTSCSDRCEKYIDSSSIETKKN